MIGVPKPETHKARKERKKALYLAFRESIFKRDGYRCQMPTETGGICGSIEGIEPHHIHGRVGKLLTDKNNVIITCRHCHTKYQYRYEMRDMLKSLVKKLNRKGSI
jgi:5-methylcytosine-specific restriction endonuclease McrA